MAANDVGLGVSRRIILRGALVGTATLAISALAQAPAMAAPARGGLAAAGVRKGARTVRGADGSTVLMPTLLGASMVVGGGGLAAGTSLTFTFDTRLYRVRPAVARRGATVVSLAPQQQYSVDKATSRGTLVVVVTQPLAPGDYVLVAGDLMPHRYPHDLVAQPVPLTVTGRHAGGAVLAEEVLSRPAARDDVPWGVELGAAWMEARWDEQYLALYPALVTVLSTGPGPVPSGFSVRVSLDRQVFPAVTVSGARNSAGQAVPGTGGRGRAAAGFATAAWTSRVSLPAGSRVSLTIATELRTLRGPLALLQPPVAELVAAPKSRAQRLTGLESLTRHESIYSPSTLQEFVSW